MKPIREQKWTGVLLIAGALGVFIPYTLLVISFDYPDILRKDSGLILERFYTAGNSLIGLWWLFAFLGLPLMAAYKMLNNLFEQGSAAISWLSIFGTVGLVAQFIGLLRWPFVVSVLAKHHHFGDASTKASARMLFEIVHQFGGVLLGEHVGQLFTVIWMMGLSVIIFKTKIFPRWMAWLGFIASGIYLTAQAELAATVIPEFPVWGVAGLLGSTLWLIWLTVIGFYLIGLKRNIHDESAAIV